MLFLPLAEININTKPSDHFFDDLGFDFSVQLVGKKVSIRSNSATQVPGFWQWHGFSTGPGIGVSSIGGHACPLR